MEREAISRPHTRIRENCKRPYDLIEAFTPKIYEALRTFHSGVALSEKEIASLSVFCRRMEAAKLDNHKLDAKLSAMLLAAFTILGDRAAAEKASARFQKISAHSHQPLDTSPS